MSQGICPSAICAKCGRSENLATDVLMARLETVERGYSRSFVGGLLRAIVTALDTGVCLRCALRNEESLEVRS